MLNLIMKDILVQKRTLVFAFLYSIFIFFVFSRPPLSHFIFSMSAVAISYIFILTALQADFKNNMIMILNSLPVRRSEIVAAKYLSLFVFIAFSFVVLVTVGLLIKVSPLPFPVRYPALHDLVITFLSVGLMISVYMPVYFKTGGRWVQIINILFFMLIFFTPGTVAGFLAEKQDQATVQSLVWHAGENMVLVYLTAVLVTLIILAVSFLCARKIFINRDL